MVFKKLFYSCINILFPSTCIVCETHPAAYPLPICGECKKNILNGSSPPVLSSYRLQKIWSCRIYEGAVKECIKKFKYITESESFYLKALEFYENSAQTNPDVFLPKLISVQLRLGAIYDDANNLTKAKRMYLNALKNMQTIEHTNPLYTKQIKNTHILLSLLHKLGK